MKEFLISIWELLGKNLSNVFGFVGIAATIYFGAFYFPNWFEESKNEKLKNTKSELIQSIKELSYDNSVFTFKEFESLVKGKDIQLGQKYPYSLQEIIIQAQESFMEDRFLSLEKRKSLMYKLEILKDQIPKASPKERENEKDKIYGLRWVGWISIFLSIVAGVAGLFSFNSKFKTEKEKQEEENAEIQQAEASEQTFEYAYQFERRITEIIKNYLPESEIEDSQINRDSGIDFEFHHGNKHIYVFIKYYRKSKVGLQGISPLWNTILNKTGEVWLIYGTDLTTMAKRRIKEFNIANSKIQIKLIHISNSEDFKEKISELLPINA